MTQPLHLKPTQPPSIREKDPWVCRSAAGVPRVDPGPAGRSLLAPTAGARGPGLAAPGLPLPPPRAPAPQMPAIAVLAAAAAAWCLLQVESRHLDALAGGAGPNNGNFLDNDQWLSTVSEYERDKYWNRFRDVSTRGPCGWRESLRARGGWWLGGRCGTVPLLNVWERRWCRLRRQLVGSGFMGFILPERNFKDNLEGLMLFAPVTCGPGVCNWYDWGKVTALNMLTASSCGDRGSLSFRVLLMLLVDFIKPPGEPPWAAVT